MDWDAIGPFIAKNRELIATVVETDTRKLSTWDEFQVATANEIPKVRKQDDICH